MRALGLESISQVALLLNWGYSQIQLCIVEFNFSVNLGLSRILAVCCSNRPQPEGDFDSLTGKFKIMMYEACVASLEHSVRLLFLILCLWAVTTSLRSDTCIHYVFGRGRTLVQIGKFARSAAYFRASHSSDVVGRTLHHNMCSDNRARYGAMTQNIVVATAYATLGTEAVVHAVNEGEIANGL